MLCQIAQPLQLTHGQRSVTHRMQNLQLIVSRFQSQQRTAMTRTDFVRQQRLLCVEVTDEATGAGGGGGDLTFHHSFSVSESEFADIKADQAILVEFSALPEMFIELLNQCLAGEGAGDATR